MAPVKVGNGYVGSGRSPKTVPDGPWPERAPQTNKLGWVARRKAKK